MLQCNAAILSKHIPFHGKSVAEGVESVRILEKLGKAVLCALLVLALLGAAAGAETLRVGVRDDIINFGFYNETTGKYYGLEIDLAAELARRIGYDDVEYITVTPDTRKDMLLNGEVDVVIATYSIAESREENFDFSAPYYEDDTIIMVEKSTLFGSIRDLKDKNIGIVNGTNAGPSSPTWWWKTPTPSPSTRAPTLPRPSAMRTSTPCWRPARSTPPAWTPVSPRPT